MAHQRLRKSCVVLVCVLYGFWCTGGVYAAQSEGAAAFLQMAQTNGGASAEDELSAAEEEIIRWRYGTHIRNIEEDMNTARGQRDMLLTLAIATGFIGGGLALGTQSITTTVEDLEEQIAEEDQDDVEMALDMLGGVENAGVVTLAVGGTCLLGYLLYSVGIGDKQKAIDALQAELDTRIKRQGMYAPQSETYQAVENKVAEMKKTVGAISSMGSTFTRIAVGSLLSGGFMAGLGLLTDDVVNKIDINEDIEGDVKARDEAVDAATNLKNTGYILLGVGGATGLLAVISGLWVRGEQKRIDKLEDNLLPRVAKNVRFQPKLNGFRISVSYQF